MASLTEDQVESLRRLICRWLPTDSEIGSLAVAKGLLTATQRVEMEREQARRRAEGESLSLAQVLVRHGFLSCAQFGRLVRSHGPACASEVWDAEREERDPTGATVVAEGSPGAASAALPRVVGRYRILREIGRGGMGIVCEAEDVGLRRRVALKLLREEDVDARAVLRFHREAAVAGHLSHPGIVQVYDVGEDGGVHFIAMELVDGRPLSLDVIASLPLRRRVEILRDVADAIGFAHARGVVHRDLKPANILLDSSGRARVCDFGLARLEGDVTRLTRTGAVMGTPSYMAPEQVRGLTSSISSATDVWALGVTLYELLVGAPPFTGTDLYSIYEQIMEADPIPPRRIVADVPMELEAICLKAMSKEPPDRYENASECAAELNRWLEGSPVLARPAGRWTRLARKVRRHRRLVLGVSGVVALSLVVIGALAWLWHRETERALSEMRERARTSLEAAVGFRRAGDLERMRAFLPGVVEACRRVMERRPDLAEPHALLGRMYRAVLEEDRAIEELDFALEREPGDAVLRYERGLLLYRRYTRRLVERIHEAGLVASEVAAEDVASYATPAMSGELARARGDFAWAAHAEGACGVDAACAAGWLAFLEDELEEARLHLDRARRLDPNRDETYEALATIERQAGRIQEAERIQSSACEADKGNASHFATRAELRYMLAESELENGADPTAWYDRCRQDLDGAIRLSPTSASLVCDRGECRLSHALWRQGNDLDASQELAAAIADFEEARRLDGTLDQALVGLAAALLTRAQAPDHILTQAHADLLEAIRLVDEARQRRPDHRRAGLVRAVAHAQLAEKLSWLDRPTLPTLQTARQAFEEVLSKWPDWGVAHEEMGWMLCNWAMSIRGGPAEEVDPIRKQAVEELGRVQKLEGKSLRTLLVVARGHLVLAGVCILRGEDPQADLKATREAIDAGLALAPDSLAFVGLRGCLAGETAKWMDVTRQPAGEMFEAAERDLTFFIERSPSPLPRVSARGSYRMNRALYTRSIGGDAEGAFAAAATDFDRVVSARGSDPEAYSNRAMNQVAWAQGESGEERQRHAAAALADYDRAVALTPDDSNRYLDRSRAYYLLERYEEALADLQKAVELNPLLRDHVKQSMEDLRQMIEEQKNK